LALEYQEMHITLCQTGWLIVIAKSLKFS